MAAAKPFTPTHHVVLPDGWVQIFDDMYKRYPWLRLCRGMQRSSMSSTAPLQCIADSITFTLRRATRNGLRQRRLEGSTTHLQQVEPPLDIGSGGSRGTLKGTLDVRLDADASSAALRATLGALDEPVFEGVIAAHSASTDSRSAPPACGSTSACGCLLPTYSRSPRPGGTFCTALRPLPVARGPYSPPHARHQVRKHQVP